MLFEILFGITLVVIIILILKIVMLRGAFKEISEQIDERVKGKTNTPITISTSDSAARKSVSVINSELDELNREKVRITNSNSDINKAVTNIAHDIRTPLTAINSYVDLLAEEKDEEVRSEYIQRLKNRTEYMSDLTNELFKYSVSTDRSLKNAEVNKEITCDIRGVLEDCILSFYNVFTSKGITPSINLPEESVFAFIDSRDANRVFENIISNGLKYAENKFEISLEESGKITFNNDANDLTNVEVARLFDKYYTVKNTAASTGLGLSIAKELVGICGGEISAHLSEDKVFVIEVILKIEE